MMHAVELVSSISPEIEMQRHEHQNVELWVSELREAGWSPVRSGLWKDPEGTLHLGPFGAWRQLKVRQGRKVLA